MARNIVCERLRELNYLKATVSYVVLIVLINSMFVAIPLLNIAGGQFSPADTVVGSVYILRDFAQREIKHYVIIAMLVGAGLSYSLADESVAIASLGAFVVGECIDWVIFTVTQKPLSQRLLFSSLISVPLDTVIFLTLINRMSLLEFSVMLVFKILGVMVLWLGWKLKNQQQTASQPKQTYHEVKSSAG